MAHSEIPSFWQGPGEDPPIVRGIRYALQANDFDAAARHLTQQGVVATQVTGDRRVGSDGLSFHASVRPHSPVAYWRECTQVDLVVHFALYALGCLIPIPPTVIGRGAVLTFQTSTEGRQLGWITVTPEIGCRLVWALEHRAGEHDPPPVVVERASRLRWDTPIQEIVTLRHEIQRAIDDEGLAPTRRLAALHRAAGWTQVAAIAALEHELLGGER